MPSTPSDITLAVGDGARRMTYAELAAVRGISLPSARRLVIRHRWPRQAGNDGVVRVTVPLTALAKSRNSAGAGTATDTVTSDSLSDATDTVTVSGDTLTDPVIVTLTRAVDSLREQLVIANARADRAERRVEELQETLTEERRRLIEILTESRASWWRRWFR
jgi:hypothetical protein